MRQSGANIYTVTQVNHAIKLLLEDQDAFRNLYIQGELSNYKKYPSGHHYFTLKDADGVLSAVMFRSDAARLRFQPENGMKVIARGRISVYPQRGQYQMYVADMMPDGIGALTIAFEQLKQRLYQEGLFDEGHKKPIPRLPARIAVVTSPTGAAVRDILRILKQRYPIAHVVIYPVLVQGKEAAGQIVAAIEAVNRRHDADVMIVGRGGGSLEDLWAFNEEIVARALYASEIPGHFRRRTRAGYYHFGFCRGCQSVYAVQCGGNCCGRHAHDSRRSVSCQYGHARRYAGYVTRLSAAFGSAGQAP